MVKNLPVVHAHWISRLVKFLRLDRQISRLFLNQYLTLMVDASVYGLSVDSVKIDEATLGNKTIVEAVEGKRICVYAYSVVVGGAVKLVWKSGSVPISGIMEFANMAEGLCAGVVPPYFLFRTKVGEALVLAVSVDKGVGGHLSYFLEDD